MDHLTHFKLGDEDNEKIFDILSNPSPNPSVTFAFSLPKHIFTKHVVKGMVLGSDCCDVGVLFNFLLQ